MKCGTESCSSEATTEVFWPGQTTRMCDPCAARARGIGEAMGFTVDTRPLPSDDVTAWEERHPMGDDDRPRRRDEQAMADRIGRAFTDRMPLALLMALTAWEERKPGEVVGLFAGEGGAAYIDAFWSAFWREFQAAQAVARARNTP